MSLLSRANALVFSALALLAAAAPLHAEEGKVISRWRAGNTAFVSERDGERHTRWATKASERGPVFETLREGKKVLKAKFARSTRAAEGVGREAVVLSESTLDEGDGRITKTSGSRGRTRFFESRTTTGIPEIGTATVTTEEHALEPKLGKRSPVASVTRTQEFGEAGGSDELTLMVEASEGARAAKAAKHPSFKRH